jgi:hypothetical protein
MAQSDGGERVEVVKATLFLLPYLGGGKFRTYHSDWEVDLAEVHVPK